MFVLNRSVICLMFVCCHKCKVMIFSIILFSSVCLPKQIDNQIIKNFNNFHELLKNDHSLTSNSYISLFNKSYVMLIYNLFEKKPTGQKFYQATTTNTYAKTCVKNEDLSYSKHLPKKCGLSKLCFPCLRLCIRWCCPTSWRCLVPRSLYSRMSMLTWSCKVL